MESVVLGFLKAAGLAVSVFVVPVFFIVVIKFLFKQTKIVGKKFHELIAATKIAIFEIYQSRSLKNLSEDSYIVLFAWFTVVAVVTTFFSLDIYFGLDRIGYTIPVLAVLCVTFLILFVYVFFMALEKGQEKIVEQLAFFNIVLIVALVIAVVWDELLDSKSSIEIVRTITMIIAGAVGLLALTIAFLNYKRKSGFVVESYFDLIVNKGCYFYFSNLKDRAIVIYDFTIETINLEYYMNLKSPIVVSPYGLEEYKMENICSLFTDSTSSEFAMGCLVDSELNVVLSEMRQELLLGNYKIRANTSFGEKYFITQNGGVGMKDSAVTSKKGKIIMHTHFNVDKANKTIKRNDVFKLEKTQTPNKKYKTAKLFDSDKELVLFKLRQKEVESMTPEDLSGILSGF